ncbi:MAG: hypothetical protein F6K41_28885 [Symploca sp. SIO3E6]|nr:hypothetical protein [Caldora sp. SIO3E6]
MSFNNLVLTIDSLTLARRQEKNGRKVLQLPYKLEKLSFTTPDDSALPRLKI